MSYLRDTDYPTENIRAVELRFDIIKDAGSHFVLYQNGKMVGTVLKAPLAERTRSTLTSLSEWELSNGIS